MDDIPEEDIEDLYPEKMQKMYRNVISGAVRDLGCGESDEIQEVQMWIGKDSFSVCCEIANWNSDWVTDLLESIDGLSHPVRKPITRQCLEMLRAVIRITGRGAPDPYMFTASNVSFGLDRVDETREQKYIGHTPSIMSRQAKASHEKLGGWNRKKQP